MRFFTPWLMLAVLVGFAATGWSATLHWELPSTRENGESLPASQITAVKIFRNGGIIATLPGTAVSYEVSSCTGGAYTATVTASGLDSVQSNTVDVAIDNVGCRPKPPKLVAAP